jgi:shikimate dehydrogenase
MLTGNAKIAGVIGWPVSHSLSPRLHGYWLREYGIDGAYIPMAVPPEKFTDAIHGLPALGFAGANVTIPHKEAAFAAMDETDAGATAMGAVNTIIVRDDGSIFGSNTDGFGFMESIQAELPDWQADQGPVLILGAGGAARGIAVTLLSAGAKEIRFANRTQKRADDLADLLGDAASAVAWADRAGAVDGAALVVNTTSLGMTGKEPLEMDLSSLSSSAIVYDVVYSPQETPLLAAARAKGNTGVDGLGMLLHQARPGFEAWFGIAPTVTAAQRDFVLRAE